MKIETVQKVRMCVSTYYNLNGVMPSVQEMAEWSGESFDTVFHIMVAEAIGRTGNAA